MQDSDALDVGASNEAAQAPSVAALAAIRNRSSTAVLGDVAWLMMESSWYRGHAVKDFARLVMPPIGHKQFRLFHEGNVPIAFLSWAMLSPDAEGRFLADPFSLEPADWSSGDAAYLVDFLTRKNAFRKILPYLRVDPLLGRGPVRGLRTRRGVSTLIEIAAETNRVRIRARRLD